MLLLADDDETGALLTQRAFKAAGIVEPVVYVRNGAAAIEFLANATEVPRLALLDQNLPRRTGLEVLEWIRRESPLPTLPVLLLSGSEYDSDVQAAYLVGANGYLVKPSTYEATVEMAKAVQAYWLGVNRGPRARG
ncbi:MAG: response regulator [Betaproteobacteria bacterium]